MSLQLVQRGFGERRALALAYFVGDFAALRAGLPPSACILADLANGNGRLAGVPGAGGVAPLLTAMGEAQRLAGPFTPSAIVLIGWSAGCQALRELLRSGARPDAVVALDGTSSEVPPRASQLAPWHAFADRARRGEALFVLTATQQLYTRDLPSWQRYEATAYVVTELWTRERPLSTGELLAPGEELRDGDFVVAVHASKRIDGPAHLREQNVHLPDLLTRLVSPWLAARTGMATRDTDPAPAPDTTPTGAAPPRDAKALQRGLNARGATAPLDVDGDIGPLTRAALRAFQARHGLPVTGQADAATWAALDVQQARVEGGASIGLLALERLRGEIGVHETPGPGYTPRVVEYGSGAMRGDKRLDLGKTDEPAWCAALQGWAERDLPGALPWRWSVAERWADAKARGLTRPKTYRAKAGDEAIFARGGGDPRYGGTGHDARVERDVDDAGDFATIGGNEGGAAHHGGEVLHTERNTSDPTLVGFLVRT